MGNAPGVTIIEWRAITPMIAGQGKVGVIAVVRWATLELHVPFANAAWRGPSSLRAAMPVHRDLTTQPKPRFIGQPMIVLEVGGRPFSCFLDTGSEVTMVKKEAVTCMLGVRLHASLRALQGVSGWPVPVVAEADLTFTINPKSTVIHRTCVVENLRFPGDVLIGMDLLHRFPVRMILDGVPDASYVELDGYRCKLTFTRGGSMGYHVPACQDAADETPEAVEFLELSQSPSPLAVSPVHVAEETVVEAKSGKFVAATVTCGSPVDMCLARVESGTDLLTVPRTLVTVRGRRSSVWVVNPHPKPRKIRPGTMLGYASFLGPEDLVATAPTSVTRETPAEPLMATASPEESKEFPGGVNLCTVVNSWTMTTIVLQHVWT